MPLRQKQNDLFVYLGDNIYGDTEDMNVLLAKYGKLSCKTEFQNLLNSCKVIATWDDHDYGVNDGGVEYPMKVESKNIFLTSGTNPKFLNAEITQVFTLPITTEIQRIA